METEAKVRTKIEWHKLEKKLNNLAPVLHALIVIADNLANFPNVIDKSIQSLKTYCIREHFSIAENLQKLADTHKITIKELLVLPIKHMSATRYQDIHIPTYGEYLEWSDIEILNHLNAFRPAGETSNRSPLEAETTHIVKIVEEHIKAVGSSK